VVATNPAHSWINQADARDVLGRLDFLVVQDMYDSSETADLADLILPASGWGEKEGCFINSERRISVVKQVARAPGTALSDFRIFQLISESWGCGEMFREWESPEAVFHILKDLTRGMPCDITGIEGYQQIDEMRGIQWPLPEGRTPQRLEQRRLFEDRRFHTREWSGQVRLRSHPRPLPEAVDAFFRFTLLTGRGSSAQWHTQTRTGKSPVLNTLAPEDQYVELSPPGRGGPRRDAQQLGARVFAAGFVGGARVRDPHRAARAGVHADALRGDQQAHVCMRLILTRGNRLTSTVRSACREAERVRRNATLTSVDCVSCVFTSFKNEVETLR
jgi:predicted molibdopterin-dependent oxidoreductase YjgC